MVADAERFRHVDDVERVRVRARAGLQVTCQQVEAAAKALGPLLAETDLLRVLDSLDDTSAWLSVNPDATRREFDARRKRLDAKVDPVLKAAYDRWSQAQQTVDAAAAAKRKAED